MTAGALDPDPIPRYPDDRDDRLKRAVVIKRLTGKPTAAAIERFVREARLQGRLEHPAIVPVLDVGVEPDGRPYFVMRQVHGTSLDELLRRRASGDREADRAVPLRRLLAAFVDVCLAIEYAHTRGVVHRALRPEHVLLGDFGEVYVTEWGAARLLDAEGAVVRETLSPPLPDGTLGASAAPIKGGYAAPEQLMGEPDIDARADVYALGCILYEILCLGPMHPPDDAVASTMQGVDVGAAARAAGRNVPLELLDACTAATRSRVERTGSARSLADSVSRWLAGNRDLSRRRELAARHRDLARAALERGDRAAALREAGSAVAVMPGDAASAGLLGRLVLEPPAVDPAADAATIAASDAEETRAQGRIAALSYLTVPGLLPLYLWLGVLDWTVPIAIACLGLMLAAFALQVARGGPGVERWVWISTTGNVALVALYGRVFSPLVATPAIAATAAMAAVALPGMRRWWLIPVALSLGVLGPLALELAGVLEPTIDVTGESVRVMSSVVELSRGPVLLVVALQTMALIAVSVAYSRQLARVNRAARARLLSQAWHLEQIVQRG